MIEKIRWNKAAGAWAITLVTLLIPIVAVATHLSAESSPNRLKVPSARSVLPQEPAAIYGAVAPVTLPPAATPETTGILPIPIETAGETKGAPQADVEPPAPKRTPADVEAEHEAAFLESGPAGPEDEKNVALVRAGFDASEIDVLECRGSRCRMELSFASAESAGKRLQEVFLDPQSELQIGGTVTSRWQDDDGKTHVRVHLHHH